MFSFSCLILCSLFFKLNAQDIAYAHRIINALTDSSMHGRGYVNDGNKIAADFLAQQFDSLHLIPFGKNYFQKFSFDVNSFPGAMSMSIDGKELAAGKDFIMEASSGSSSKSFVPVFINKTLMDEKSDLSELFNSDLSKKILVLDSAGMSKDQKNLFNRIAAAGIPSEKKFLGAVMIIAEKKLTMDMAQEEKKYPQVIVLRSAIPKDFKKVSFRIENKFLKNYPSQNVIGYIKGKSQPDSFLVFSAHFDHLGQMGRSVYFPGANDNASGVALIMNLAEYFSSKDNQPECSIAFMAFTGEEIGLLGSKYYTEHPLFPLAQIKFLINLDLLGTGEAGMMVVNATEFPKQFHVLDSINTTHQYLKTIGQRGKAMNSDHYFFTERGVPSFFFYTMGGIQAYHDVYDIAATLPLTEFEDVVKLIVGFSKSFDKN